jgi:hypothetical protein
MADPVDPVVAEDMDPNTPRRRGLSKSWVPTRKWLAAQVVALAAIATSAIDSGWDDTEWKLAIAWAVQAAVTYLLPNEDTPGGVPLKR